MPARSHQIVGGARVLLFTCETCGRAASHGVEVGSIRAAWDAGSTKKLGRWYCAAHIKDVLTTRAQDASITLENDHAGSTGNRDLLGG
jgi:hypothetical protein